MKFLKTSHQKYHTCEIISITFLYSIMLRLSMPQKQQIKVALHRPITEELNDMIRRYNANLKESYIEMDIESDTHTPEEDYLYESEGVEYCIDAWQDDENKENIQQIMQMIERIRDAYEHEDKENKTFRINIVYYDALVSLKEILNKHNKFYKTYKIEDVLEYLIQTYNFAEL